MVDDAAENLCSLERAEGRAEPANAGTGGLGEAPERVEGESFGGCPLLNVL